MDKYSDLFFRTTKGYIAYSIMLGLFMLTSFILALFLMIFYLQ